MKKFTENRKDGQFQKCPVLVHLSGLVKTIFEGFNTFFEQFSFRSDFTQLCVASVRRRHHCFSYGRSITYNYYLKYRVSRVHHNGCPGVILHMYLFFTTVSTAMANQIIVISQPFRGDNNKVFYKQNYTNFEYKSLL